MGVIEELYYAQKIKYDRCEKENQKFQQEIINKKGQNTDMEG